MTHTHTHGTCTCTDHQDTEEDWLDGRQISETVYTVVVRLDGSGPTSMCVNGCPEVGMYSSK